MKYKIGDKIFASYRALALWHNPYSFKEGFSHCIMTVMTASEERFSDSEGVDLYYPSMMQSVYHQGTGSCIDSNERMYHLEHDKQLIHDLISQSFTKELKKAKDDKAKEKHRLTEWIVRYQLQLETLLNNDTKQEKLVKDRYADLRDTLFPN